MREKLFGVFNIAIWSPLKYLFPESAGILMIDVQIMDFFFMKGQEKSIICTTPPNSPKIHVRSIERSFIFFYERLADKKCSYAYMYIAELLGSRTLNTWYAGPILCNLYFVFYFREVSELIISIIQARDLTPNQYSGTLDTYIRGIILPNSDAKFQSKVSSTNEFKIFNFSSFSLYCHVFTD